jgi:hypothetical protein
MLVCTLPSPACMCRATNTRLFSTRRWIASHAASTGSYSRPVNSWRSSARTSRFQDTRISWSRRAESLRAPSGEGHRAGRDNASVRTSAISSRARARRAAVSSGSATDFLVLARRRQRPLKKASSASSSASLLAIDSSMLMRSTPSVIAQAGERNHHVLVDLEGVGVGGDGGGARAVRQNALRASGVTAIKPAPPRARASSTMRAAAASAASSSAGEVGQQHHVRPSRCGWPWWRSRPP